MYFDQIEFGKRLRILRTEKKMSQETTAERIGISASHYWHLEHGDKGCSIDLLLILAETFHVSTDYLLTGTCAGREEEISRLKGVIEEITNVIDNMQARP